MEDLKNYLNSHEGVDFSWSDNNCLSFVSGYHKGVFPKDWVEGYSTTREAVVAYRKNLKAYGYEDILDAMDDILEPCLTLHPKDGLVVAKKTDSVMGYVFGLTYMGVGWFLSEDSLIALDVEYTDRFWNVV